MRTTVVTEPTTPTQVHTADADYAALIRAERQRMMWAAFGTIGYDAYLQWVLEQGSVDLCLTMSIG
jgi:hypothetical protein